MSLRLTCASKTGYGSEREAEKALAEARRVHFHVGNGSIKGYAPTRSYRCVDCGRWHLSHSYHRDPEHLRAHLTRTEQARAIRTKYNREQNRKRDGFVNPPRVA